MMQYVHLLPRSEANKLKRLRMSHNEYVARLIANNGNVIPCEVYKGIEMKIIHVCLACGHEWEASPNNILRGRGCPECMKRKLSAQYTHSENQYIAKLSALDVPYVLTGAYINAKTKTMHKCLICSNEWEATPSNILSHASGCPYCKVQKQILRNSFTDNQFKELLKGKKHPHIKVIGRYINMKTQIEVLCTQCGRISKMYPEPLLRGSDCRQCSYEAISQKERKSEDEFLNDMSILHPEIRILSHYKNMRTNVLFEIIATGERRMVSPMALYNSGNYLFNEYKGEKAIGDILKKYNIPYIHSKRFSDLRGVLHPLEYDFYIPSRQILIEYQGMQHERPVKHFGGEKQFEKQQKHDMLKREYAKEHGIKLIEIWYYDYDHIEEILIKELKLDTAETAG